MLEKRRIILLVICFAALCLSTAPASASMFDFQFSNLTSEYIDTGGAFSASITPDATLGGVTRLDPLGVASFIPSFWLGSENFELSMTIINIDNALLTADGVLGEFTLTDIGGDTITGNLTGQWTTSSFLPDPGGGSPNIFIGELSNVTFNNESGDSTFDGHFGSSAWMDFTEIPPWYGTLIEMSSGGTWFGLELDYTTDSGGVIASVVGPVSTPVPAAVLLGIIGLGVAGLKLRKYA